MFGSIEKKIEKINALAGKKKTDQVIKFATGKDVALRAAAAKALGTITADESYNQLVLMTRDPEIAVRKAAVLGLGEIGRKAGADHVRHVMINETDADLIKTCQTAISKIINGDVR